MTTDGKSILNLMSEIRKLCDQIALLLGTSDQLVGEDNWITANSTTVTGGNSSSLSYPKWWVPEFFCRFYTQSRLPHVLLYLAVILDNRENNEEYIAREKREFDEPILTSGYYVYPDNRIGNWNVNRCKWHIYSADPLYDGKIFTTRPKEDWAEHEKNFDWLRSLAIPLVSVNNSDDLKSLVIDPILSDIEETFRDVAPEAESM